MDVMESSSAHDLFQGLTNHSFMDSMSYDDNEAEDKDSLLDLLTQSFPDMLTQSYGHLSSLPLDTPDLHLCLQEDDDDDQASDSDDDAVLQEFVCEVQNILAVNKGTNITNAPDLDGSLSLIPPLLSEPDKPTDPFSPVKKTWLDNLDLLTGPLLSGDDDEKSLPSSVVKSAVTLFGPTLGRAAPTVKPAGTVVVASVKPLGSWKPVENSVVPLVMMSEPKGLFSKAKELGNCKPVVASVKPILKVVKMEEESSDEVDIETVDDEELNGMSGAAALSAKLADMDCQAARVRVISKSQLKSNRLPPKFTLSNVNLDSAKAKSTEKCFPKVSQPIDSSNVQPWTTDVVVKNEKESSPLSSPVKINHAVPQTSIEMPVQINEVSYLPGEVKISHTTISPQTSSIFKSHRPPCVEELSSVLVEENVNCAIVAPQTSSLIPSLSAPQVKETSPLLVVEKIKQAAIVPRTSILIPYQGSPQVKISKTVRAELNKVDLVKVKQEPADCFNNEARKLDHDYCTWGLNASLPSGSQGETVLDPWVVSTDNLCVSESVIMTELEVPTAIADSNHRTAQSSPKSSEKNIKCEPVETLSQPTPVIQSTVKSEKELPLSYSKWRNSRSPSPPTLSCKKGRTRRRSSCSPSSVSSQSVYRSHSRSPSLDRKSRSHTHYRRNQSRSRPSSLSRRSSKRSRYTYSRSSSRSSFSSRSRSRSRSRSWDYNRSYTNSSRSSVSSYSWAQEKRQQVHEEKNQQIEERRVVYVGRLPDGTTKADLRHRFGVYGTIQEVSVHFRESGHNYGFVTFSYKSDAYQAVEHGNDDPTKPKFDLSFGGRRQFCKQRYADLDSQYTNYPAQRPVAQPSDFDSLLRAAKTKLKY